MTRREQLSMANEIMVLCGIVATYFASHTPPSPDQTQAVFDLEAYSAMFLELTESIVDDPDAKGICPACGEDL